jgi:hypothetical protein
MHDFIGFIPFPLFLFLAVMPYSGTKQLFPIKQIHVKLFSLEIFETKFRSVFNIEILAGKYVYKNPVGVMVAMQGNA